MPNSIHHIPRPMREAYACFRSSAAYDQELARSEAVLYTPAQLQHPQFRFRRDQPPFLFAGNLDDGQAKWMTFGLNPKVSSPGQPQPATVHEYYSAACNAFAKWPPSRFHSTFLRIIAGINAMAYPASFADGWANRFYLTLDLLPFYSDRWGVGRLTPPRIREICRHLSTSESLLARVADVKFVLLNGKPFADLFLDGGAGFAPDRRFVETDRFSYASVTGKQQKGSVRIGTLELAGRTSPAAILTHFIHQARPPLSAGALARLGTEIRLRL